MLALLPHDGVRTKRDRSWVHRGVVGFDQLVQVRVAFLQIGLRAAFRSWAGGQREASRKAEHPRTGRREDVEALGNRERRTDLVRELR